MYYYFFKLFMPNSPVSRVVYVVACIIKMIMFLSTLHLWLIGICLVIVLGLALGILFCVCWIRTKNKNACHYAFEDLPSPRRNSFLEIINIYRSFRNPENSQDKLLNEDQLNIDQNLIDSTDLSNRFTSSSLRIINPGTEDMNAYGSTSSLRTYYSTNLSRSNSKRTFFSCSEGSDTGEIV